MNTDFEVLVQADVPVLVDVHAQWCGPCRAMLPILDELQAELGDRLRIVKVDVDEQTDLAVQLQVMGVPTFMVYRHGREVWRQAGAMTKTALQYVVEAAEKM